MTVLYIPQAGNVEPTLADFRAAAAGRLDVAVFDHAKEVRPQFSGAQVVVDHGGHASRAMIDAGAEVGVRLWQVIGNGLDHTEVRYTLDKAIPMANTPGRFTAVPLAEHALFFILCLAKRLRESEAACRAAHMYFPITYELAELEVGIVGLGASGRELARRAAALGMRVRAVDPMPVDDDVLGELGVTQFEGEDGLDDLLASADFVSLHLPLSAATRHLVDARRLGLMKPTAYLINVARGGLVDEAALVEALRSGAIAGAGIDVFSQEPLRPDNPLIGLDTVIATAHNAGATRGVSRRRCAAAVENAERALRGEQPLFLVTSAG